jgi:hypothetical protein
MSESPVPPTTRKDLKAFLVWSLLLGLGLLLLVGRYDWRSDTAASLGGYVSSGYLFLLVVPTFHGLLGLLGVSGRGRHLASLVIAVVLCLPFSWLGLDRFRQRAESVRWSDPSLPPPSTQWLTDDHARLLSVPHEVPFFLAIAGVGFLALGLWTNRHRSTRRRAAAYPALLFALVVAQTWLHQSLRSPYTYLCHFEQPRVNQYWHHVYLFPGGQGAVNADNFVFRELEAHFLGFPGHKTFMLIRRSLVFYLSSPFVYFFNPYYVFVIGNIGLWWMASLCARSLATNWFDSWVGKVTGLLVATGTGFIFYVAQPFNYLAAWALVAILLWVYERWIASNSGHWPDAGKILLLGAFLGLAAMVYDVFPLLVFVIGYGMYRRVPLLAVVGSLSLAAAAYLGFVWLQMSCLGITVDTSNLKDITLARNNWFTLLTRPSLYRAYGLCVRLAELFAGHMAKTFLVLPLIPAMVGVTALRTRQQKLVVGLLLAQSVLTLAYFLGGDSMLLGLPRFVYSSYLAVYALAAVGIRELAGSRHRRSFAVAFLIAVALLNNIDILGYPRLYYHFYHGGQTTSSGYFGFR